MSRKALSSSLLCCLEVDTFFLLRPVEKYFQNHISVALMAVVFLYTGIVLSKP